MMSRSIFFILVLFPLLIVSCRKEEPSLLIEILDISNITQCSAVFSCNTSILSPGLSIFEEGICISDSPYPVASTDSPVGGINTPGKYNASASDLLPDKKYYVKAFVNTEMGYLYSDIYSFTTQPVSKFTDQRDGQEYFYIDYFDNSWMVENLNYRTEGSYYFNNDSSKYASDNGRLYSYSAAEQACPSGWKLPTDEDWKKLEIEVGMQPSEVILEGPRGTIQGSLLKEPGNRLWLGNENNETATNGSGFTAKPSGAYSIDNKVFSNQGQTGYHAVLWTEADASSISYIRVLHSHLETITRSPVSKTNGVAYSVRCIKIK